MIIKNLLLFASTITLFTMSSCGSFSENERESQGSANVDSALEEGATPVAEGTQIAFVNITSTTDTVVNLGSAKFYRLADGQIKMDLEITIKERADSAVAVHFHEKGSCGNKGEDAGPHWNPTNENHGEWGASHHHSGDIGNIQLDANGKGTVSLTTDKWNIDLNEPARDFIGKTIIVHGGTDDYTSQPSGNSGPRIGCGIIQKL